MCKVINVGIIGYGVVGRGTTALLVQNKQTILNKTGIAIQVHGVASLDLDENDEYLKDVPVKTNNGMDLVNNPDIDVIVELIGGYGAAKQFIEAAIKNKKHVVTANKALLAVHGKEIFALAAENNVEIGFEASVGGGIPIINVLKEDLAGNNIEEITAIINGTANYILSRMHSEGVSYQEVLKDAQKLGYAEADPTFDVEGIDSAHKITLLSSIAFGTWVNFNKVFTEGITKISASDVEFAKELGCVIKLLAIGKKHKGSVEVHVHPTMIPTHYQLASVNDSYNAVLVKGDFIGKTMFYGRGAGSLPTGSAVAGDIVRIARAVKSSSVGRVPALGFAGAVEEKMPVKDISETSSTFYLRFTVEDNPGVLSMISGIMAEGSISIRQAIQRPQTSENDYMPLVFLTHETPEKSIKSAVAKIDRLDCVKDKTVIIRVEGIN